jgi:ATP-binding cassette, subfamily B, bacterial
MTKPKRRDREITREIHRLFWQGNLVDKRSLILCYLTRIPSSALSNTVIPLVCALGIQAIIQHHHAQLIAAAWWVVGLSALYSVLWFIGGRLISINAIKGSQYIQSRVFENYLNKDYDFYTNAFFGSLGAQATRLRDAFNVYGELVTLSIPRQATIMIVSVGIIAWQSPLLALVTLIAMALVLSFTIIYSSWRARLRRLVGEASSELSHGTTVKSFAMEHDEQKRLLKPLGIWSQTQLRSWNSAQGGDVGRVMLAGIATASLLVISAGMYERGNISIAIVALIQLYVIRLIASTQEIADMVKRYEELMGQAYQPVQTMLIASRVEDPAHPKKLPNGRPEITFDRVSFGYPEATIGAVSDFSLTIKPGEKIGVVGYSGAGKTTLTKLLLRFMDTSSGQITIANTDIREITQRDLRTILSYVPQEPLLFHRSIADNIAYSKPGATSAEIHKAAKLAYVDEFVKQLPKGYDTLVGERGVKLSGGQRQRVAIARALLKDAPVLVLDEATSALDSRSEKFIQDALWRLMKDRTAVVIAHRLSTIQRLDRIIVMDKGKIVQAGTHEELRAQAGIYADLWDHQSGGYIGSPPGALAETTL